MRNATIFELKANKKMSQKKKSNTKAWIIGIGISLIVFIAMPDDSKPKEDRKKEETREEIVLKQFSAWNGSHYNFEREIKKRMNDPDSYEHIETRFTDKGDHIFLVTKFRGKNAFGGKVVNQAVGKASIEGQITFIEIGR